MEEILDAKLSIESILNISLMILISYGLLEMIYLYFFKKYEKMGDYRQTTINFFFVILMNVVLGALLGTVSTGVFALVGHQSALFDGGLQWYWWIYGLLIYEFLYWVQHWLAHKVRLLWCLHSPHHAPESMNMFVGFNHNFLEVMFYMPLFLGFLPALFGVHPIIVLCIAVVDVTWGNLLYINDSVVTGRYGILEKVFQTPSYHRVHHAQNIRYMDTNYNSITLLWDWIFGTLQPLDDNEKVVYGITRDVKTSSFMDVQFGEFVLLAKDVWNAPTLKDKISYIFMPPGWSHTGYHNTASALKEQLEQVHVTPVRES